MMSLFRHRFTSRSTWTTLWSKAPSCRNSSVDWPLVIFKSSSAGTDLLIQLIHFVLVFELWVHANESSMCNSAGQSGQLSRSSSWNSTTSMTRLPSSRQLVTRRASQLRNLAATSIRLATFAPQQIQIAHIIAYWGISQSSSSTTSIFLPRFGLSPKQTTKAAKDIMLCVPKLVDLVRCAQSITKENQLKY